MGDEAKVARIQLMGPGLQINAEIPVESLRVILSALVDVFAKEGLEAPWLPKVSAPSANV